jgi:SpoVK/Ycf46/Vps4 family AAA+-type ATPase
MQNRESDISRIEHYLRCRFSLISVISWEEVRVERNIRQITRNYFNDSNKFSVWTCTDGLKMSGTLVDANTVDPFKAIDFILKSEDSGVYLFKDLHPFLIGNPHLVRKMKDFVARAKFSNQVIILLSPLLCLPEELQKDIAIIDFALPDIEELGKLFDLLVAERLKEGNFEVRLAAKQRETLLRAALGLTITEAEKAFSRIIQGKSFLDSREIQTVINEKMNYIRVSGALEFIENEVKIKDVGGLEDLKKWAAERSLGFTQKAHAYGLPLPKGILVTGISGCGKSLCIKALANSWQMPLVRLDMTRIFSGMLGSPEEIMRRSIKTVEAVAPVLLWIDEIEMAFQSGKTDHKNSEAMRVFSSFLTWMQEKDTPVFLGATANDIDKLPPELLRKGRFDEIFFVDLPNPKEREDIFKIHLENRNNQISIYSLQGLAKQAEGFSGAEIEQCVISSMYKAFSQDRKLTIEDLFISIGSTVPLAVTMDEQIKTSKRWADSRARKASRNNSTL